MGVILGVCLRYLFLLNLLSSLLSFHKVSFGQSMVSATDTERALYEAHVELKDFYCMVL